MKIQNSRLDSAFTLTELMVVIVILVMLMALVLPAFTVVRAHLETTKCAHNLRQMSIALQSYASEHDQRLPVASATDGRTLQAGGLPIGLGSLQYYGYLGGVANVIPLGDLRSKIYDCPTLKTGGLDAYPHFCDYWYGFSDGSTQNPAGPSILTVSQAKSIVFDVIPGNASAGVHNNKTTANVLYLDGSVVNINVKNFKSKSRTSALDRP